MDDFPIKADAVDIRAGLRPDLIEVVFISDAGETKTVNFARESLPQLLASLLREAGHREETSSHPPTLSTGMEYRLTRYDLRHLDDGGLEFVLHLDLPAEKRVASIPLRMPPVDVAQLRKELNSQAREGTT